MHPNNTHDRSCVKCGNPLPSTHKIHCSWECRHNGRPSPRVRSVNTKCDTCGEMFYKRPSKRTMSNWCSIACRDKRTDIPCDVCGEMVKVPRYKMGNPHIFCSQKCAYAGKNQLTPPKRSDPLERFWGNAEMAGSEECWQWKLALSKKGYGSFYTGIKGKYVPAHRFAWMATRGDIPEGMHVCHRCDNPGCVNPDHLFLGSNSDNTSDKVRKNRQARGETSGMAKLTEAEVIEIRRRYEEMGASRNRLAETFGVSVSQIRAIVLREQWKHVSHD